MADCLGLCVCLLLRVFVWLFAGVSLLTRGYDLCPSSLPCTCSVKRDGSFVVDCSSRGLSSIPAGLPAGTTHLLLSSNHLTELRNGSFTHMSSLVLLDVGNNSLSRLHTDAFLGLERLHTLLLNKNKLNPMQGSYPAAVFHPLQQLRVIDVRNNIKCYERGEYLPISLVFPVNSSVEEIRLDVVEQRPLPADLSLLTSLTTVHLQPDSQSFCCFFNLNGSNVDAMNHTQVETLVYRDCIVTNIDTETFTNISSLKTILLEGTDLYATAPMLANAVLNSNVEKLYLNNTRMHNKAWTFITNLETSKVKSLMFDTDNIYNDYQKPPIIREVLPGLEELSLGDNYLSWTSDLTYDFLTAPNLKYLNLSWQQREHETPTHMHPDLWKTHRAAADQQVASLQQPAVQDAQRTAADTEASSLLAGRSLNLLAQLTGKPQHEQQSLQHSGHVTDASNNYLKFQPDVGEAGNPGLGFHLCGPDTICPVVVPKHLELIDISHNGLHLPQIPNILIMNKNNLKTLIMSHNRVAMLPKKMLCWQNFSMKLETFDLSSNQINHVVPDLFGRCDFTSVKHFLFAWNLFGQMCTTGQDTCDFLNPMPHIETLDMSSNEIHQLPSTFLSNHSNMRSLDLTNNSLSDISFNISHMSDLDLIDLTLNKFTCLSTRVLDMMNKVPNASICLVGNPLSCTCPCLSFVQWAFRNKQRIVDVDSTWCTLKNGTKVNMSNIKSIKAYLEDSCIDLDWAWLVGVAFLLYCLLIVVVSMVIRFQWQLRYSIYRLRLRMGRYETCTQEGPFRYDAFMAFHEEDFPWVYVKAISALEKKAKLNLCIHKRDFIPGNAIVDNICDALNASKKIVIVLTDSFLQSGWCQFEFKMAHSMSLDRGRNTLIFVILKKLHKRKITGEVMPILNAYTYLEWEEDLLREGQFWTRLEEAIREQPPSVISA